MGQVFLSLGTNLGSRRGNLQRALDGLAQEVTITAVSPIYETEPWGVTDQPRFLNLCLGGHTSLTPDELLTFCKNLEVELGRTATYQWGPRLIDIDILFYDRLILQNGRLHLPHPRLTERAFVVVPLAEIASNWVHPVIGKTISQLRTAVNVSTVHKLGQLAEIGD